jgi:arsenate reductase (glutaredoxin)
MMIKILHNPRCGKSRNCLAFIEDSGKDIEIIKYLETPPSIEELKAILEKLKLKPLDLIRQKENVWIENFKNKSLSDDEIIMAMVKNPMLIERPIVIKDNRAIIGRDLEIVKQFL